MKNSLIIGILCLGIGFGAAWIVKPDPAPATADNAPSAKGPGTPSGKSPGKGPDDQPTKSGTKPEGPKVVTRTTIVNGQEVEMSEEDRREMERGQNRFAEMMKKRQTAKEEARLNKLIAALGLTEDQADQLRKHFEENRLDLAALMQGRSSGEPDWNQAKEAAAKLRGDGLDELLAEILSPEQKEEYTAMKERERANKIETRALKDLAKVQGALDLTADQKDQVYEILHENAGTKIDTNQDANALMSIWTEGMGIEIDADEMGLSGVIQTQIDGAAAGEDIKDDPQAWMRIMKENQERRVNEKVELLAPVLDDQQEASYRAHLESKGAGLFGGMLMESEVQPPKAAE